ncbi:hypothetical protein GCM10007894_06830 [Paraferrimonas haliotis]|uniref:Uncharacterized protein n=1 Tax=Paraferrimonas haliotis TaxID=2013866 RepID=A0AA37TW99_9GAMM|nr:hypothetical protein GCM10007894_06830 [Paraferrimonas haliotis]
MPKQNQDGIEAFSYYISFVLWYVIDMLIMVDKSDGKSSREHASALANAKG